MKTKQEFEWVEAQNLVLSKDLIGTAKQQLLFLAEIDRNRCLYDGPVLHRAIYRYKFCWLPLLAKDAESPLTEDPLLVPLDCEWIWHCHRLNPVRYKNDCMELYGRILDNLNVVSSIQGTSKKGTEKIWETMYPSEPYELDLTNDSVLDFGESLLGATENTTSYDLISAVKRQTTLFYQVSRPYWNDDVFLEGAVARYKGFLHLIKRNIERSINCFCVPTYDIDLIWHSHQLHPASYCEDLVAIMGKVLEHDDTDSDRTKGQKLDVGFSETTTQWEETFGSRYWKAGAMHRGHPPSPLTVDKYKIDAMHNISASSNTNQNLIQQFPQKMLVEVMLEIVDVRDLPIENKGKLVVSFNKKQEDIIFNAKKQLSISSVSKRKQVAVFQCESSGELVFELIYHPSFNFGLVRPAKVLGKTSINLEDMQNVASKLPTEMWLDLESTVKWSKPISIRIGFSLTPPFPAPYVLHMISTSPFMGRYFSFMLPRKFRQVSNWTNIVDDAGNEVINIQTRNLASEKIRNQNINEEVIGRTASGETHLLAELKGTMWSIMNSGWMLQIKKTPDEDKHYFELTGTRKLRIRRHLRIISHRFRAFILLALVMVTGSQFACLLVITQHSGDANIYRTGELALCSVTLLSALSILFRSATKITHKAQSITGLAAKWHVCATLDSFDGVGEGNTLTAQISHEKMFPTVGTDGESDTDEAGDEEDEINTTKLIPSYSYSTISYHKRKALVNYFENNRAGVTVYGFVLDRSTIHTIFGVELSLVLWVLGKTIGIS